MNICSGVDPDHPLAALYPRRAEEALRLDTLSGCDRDIESALEIIDPQVPQGTGTFLFTNVPCRQAFDVVLRSLGLAAETYSSSMVHVETAPH